MKTLKKILSLLILLVFLFNTMGYYFVFKINQNVIRNDIRAGIQSGCSNQKVLLIKIDNPASNPNFKMLESDEFSYLGQMYDVISASVRGGTTIYYCVNDKHEENLLSGLSKIVSFTSDPCYPEHTTNILTIVHNLITLALVRDPLQSLKPACVEIIFPEYSFNSNESAPSPILPPPEAF